jgi:hypothetical protein
VPRSSCSWTRRGGAGSRWPPSAWRCQGIVDDECGVAVFSANLGWRDLPLRSLLAARTGLPVGLGHDVRAGALAEAALGAARGVRDVLFVAVGAGVAGAALVDGRLLVAGGFAGELGHLRVDPAGEPCGCGGRGCVETVASAAAIARRYAARTGRPVAGAAAVAARVRKGDPDAVAVWEEAVGALAEGLAAAVTLLAPRLVVVGRGLAGAGELLLPRSPSCCACGCRRARRACPGWWAPPSGTRPAAWARRCWPGARSTAARRRDGHDHRGGGLNPARGRPVTPAPGTGAGCSARRAAPRRRPRSGRTAAAGRRRTARSGGP